MYDYKDGQFKKWPKHKVIIHKLKNNPLFFKMSLFAVPCAALVCYGLYSSFRIGSAAERQLQQNKILYVLQDKKGKIEGEFSAREFMASSLNEEERKEEIGMQMDYFYKLYYNRYVNEGLASGELVKPKVNEYANQEEYTKARKVYKLKLRQYKRFAQRDAMEYVAQKFHLNEKVYAADGSEAF